MFYNDYFIGHHYITAWFQSYGGLWKKKKQHCLPDNMKNLIPEGKTRKEASFGTEILFEVFMNTN